MSVSVIGGSTGAAPYGAGSLVTQGFSSIGKYTYTPGSTLSAGTYTLAATGATNGLSVVINNSDRVSASGNSLTFNSSSPISSLEMSATGTPDFSNLTQAAVLPNAYAGYTNGAQWVLGDYNGRYYIYGSNTSLYYTTDFVNFTGPITVPNFSSNGTQGYGESSPRLFTDSSGNIVLIGGTYTIKSTNGGQTWTQYTNGLTSLASVAYNGTGTFVAFNSTNFYNSTDGVTWTVRTAGSGSDIIEWVNNQFVSVSSSYVYSSTDGVTWTTKTSAAGLVYTRSSLTYGNGLYYSGNGSSNSYVRYSTDLITWTYGNAPVTGHVAYLNNQFYLLNSGSSSTYYTSSNGTSWTTYNLPNNTGVSTNWTPSINYIAHNTAMNEFIFMSNTAGQYLRLNTSSTALQYAGYRVGSISAAIRVGSNIYVYDYYGNVWITSDSGATWSIKSAMFSGSYILVAVEYTGSTFLGIFITNSSTVYSATSTDGYTWTSAGTYSATGTVSSITAISDGSNIYFVHPDPSANNVKFVKVTSAGAFSSIVLFSATTTYTFGDAAGIQNGYVFVQGPSSNVNAIKLSDLTKIQLITSTNTTIAGVNSIYYLNGTWVWLSGSPYFSKTLLGFETGTSASSPTNLANAFGVINNELYVWSYSGGTYSTNSTLLKTANGLDWTNVVSVPTTNSQPASNITPYTGNGYGPGPVTRFRWKSYGSTLYYYNPTNPTVFSLYTNNVPTYN